MRGVLSDPKFYVNLVPSELSFEKSPFLTLLYFSFPPPLSLWGGPIRSCSSLFRFRLPRSASWGPVRGLDFKRIEQGSYPFSLVRSPARDGGRTPGPTPSPPRGRRSSSDRDGPWDSTDPDPLRRLVSASDGLGADLTPGRQVGSDRLRVAPASPATIIRPGFPDVLPLALLRRHGPFGVEDEPGPSVVDGLGPLGLRPPPSTRHLRRHVLIGYLVVPVGARRCVPVRRVLPFLLCVDTLAGTGGWEVGVFRDLRPPPCLASGPRDSTCREPLSATRGTVKNERYQSFFIYIYVDGPRVIDRSGPTSFRLRGLRYGSLS